MVIPDISIACIAALSVFLFLLFVQELYIKWSVFPSYGVLIVCHISDLILDGFLCCSQWRALNSAGLYILPISCLFFLYLSHCSSVRLETAKRSVASRLPSVNCDKWWGFCDDLGCYFLEIRRAYDFLHGRINKRDYLWILSNQIHTMAQELFPEENASFQDDNAPIHTTKIVNEWHEEHCNEVKHLVWPAQSPDLNIIVHLWSVLEIQVKHQFPLPSSLKERCVLTEKWLKSPLDYFTSCMNQYFGEVML